MDSKRPGAPIREIAGSGGCQSWGSKYQASKYRNLSNFGVWRGIYFR